MLKVEFIIAESQKEGEEMAIVKVQSNRTELKIFGASFLLFLLIYSSIRV